MDLQDVMTDLAAGCDSIAGLNGYAWPADEVHAPAALVAFPSQILYDGAGARGLDLIKIPILVIVPKADKESASAIMASYAGDSGGADSVKAAVEGYAATAYQEATVHRAKFAPLRLNEIDYISATFDVDVYGVGTT